MKLLPKAIPLKTNPSAMLDAIAVVPPNITEERIAEVKAWLDTALAANLASRRHFRLIQGFTVSGDDCIVSSKEGSLA